MDFAAALAASASSARRRSAAAVARAAAASAADSPPPPIAAVRSRSSRRITASASWSGVDTPGTRANAAVHASRSPTSRETSAADASAAAARASARSARASAAARALLRRDCSRRVRPRAARRLHRLRVRARGGSQRRHLHLELGDSRRVIGGSRAGSRRASRFRGVGLRGGHRLLRVAHERLRRLQRVLGRLQTLFEFASRQRVALRLELYLARSRSDGASRVVLGDGGC